MIRSSTFAVAMTVVSALAAVSPLFIAAPALADQPSSPTLASLPPPPQHPATQTLLDPLTLLQIAASLLGVIILIGLIRRALRSPISLSRLCRAPLLHPRRGFLILILHFLFVPTLAASILVAISPPPPNPNSASPPAASAPLDTSANSPAATSPSTTSPSTTTTTTSTTQPTSALSVDDQLRRNGLQYLIAYSASIFTIAAWFWVRRFPSPAQGGGRGRAVLATQNDLHASINSESIPPVTRPPSSIPASTLAAIIGLLAVMPVMALVSLLGSMITSWFTGAESPSVAHDTLRLIGTVADSSSSFADPWFLIILVSVTFAAPVVEEVVYRGTIQTMLRASGAPPALALIGASFLFAFMHWNIVPPHALLAALPALFCFGLALGLVYEFTGRLLAPILMHSLFNILNTIIILLAPPQ